MFHTVVPSSLFSLSLAHFLYVVAVFAFYIHLALYLAVFLSSFLFLFTFLLGMAREILYRVSNSKLYLKVLLCSKVGVKCIDSEGVTRAVMKCIYLLNLLLSISLWPWKMPPWRHVTGVREEVGLKSTLRRNEAVMLLLVKCCENKKRFRCPLSGHLTVGQALGT